MSHYVHEAIREAELEINLILVRLERDTGQLVEDVGLSSVAVTNLISPRVEDLRSVAIRLRDTPGVRWVTTREGR